MRAIVTMVLIGEGAFLIKMGIEAIYMPNQFQALPGLFLR
jgi:hypothetical protein